MLSRSIVRDGHGVGLLRCAAGAEGHVFVRVDAAELAGCVARMVTLLEHPAPVTISNAIVAATARCPLIWMAPPASHVAQSSDV
jgi:hypothetical protein